MRARQLVWLLVVLGVLAGAASWKKASEQKERAVTTPDADQVRLEAEIGPSFVSKIEIGHASDKLILSKDASGAWSLPSHFGAKARKETIEHFLNDLTKATTGELRSEDETVLKDFAITDDKAVHIRLYGPGGDKELVHLLLSRLRPRGTVNFVRVAASPRVIATDTDLLGDLGIFSENDRIMHSLFSDMRPAGVDSSKVVSFELAPPSGKPMTVARKEDGSGWAIAGEEKTALETAKVNEFLAGLYNLYANAPADPAAGGFAAQPWLRLRFKEGEQPPTREYFIGARDTEKKTVTFKAMPEALAYELPEGQIDPLLKKDRASFLPTKSA